VSRLYGALDPAADDAAYLPFTLVLDPGLRVIGKLQFDYAGGHAWTLLRFLASLPDPEHYAGVELAAPVLMVPLVFERELCRHLVDLFEADGGMDSGFVTDVLGSSRTIVNHSVKRRRDYTIADPLLQGELIERIRRRLLPEIEKAFHYRPTRLERTIVSCYDSTEGGHFVAHRDNENAATQHRRFAATINLNAEDYQGCDLRFPEYGTRCYRAPTGGAAVFSCSLMHEATPILSGRRYAFLPFFYGEDDAKLRLERNRRLAAGEQPYAADSDMRLE
jgi:hypothetical protein